jgi:hypothetical protein
VSGSCWQNPLSRPLARIASANSLVGRQGPAPPPTAWHDVPQWFVLGDQGLNIPVGLHRFMVERAGAKVGRELAGAPHALGLSESEAVTATILDALAAP